jgi:hypothetical protein
MEQFIAQSNISRFEEMLKHETDPEERRMLEMLLAEERLKLANASSANRAQTFAVPSTAKRPPHEIQAGIVARR